MVANWFEYDETIPWSEVDERLCSNFGKQHDEVVEMDKLKLEIYKTFESLSEHIEELRAGLNSTVTPAIAAAREAADAVLPAFRLKQSGPAYTFGIAFNAAAAAITAYSATLNILAADLAAKDKLYEAFEERVYSDDESLWDAVRDDHNLLYQEDGRHSIDYLGFDSADQRFRDTYDYHYRRWEDAIRYRDDMIVKYNTLMAEVGLQYAIWDEFALRCKLISEITLMYDTEDAAVQN